MTCVHGDDLVCAGTGLAAAAVNNLATVELLDQRTVISGMHLRKGDLRARMLRSEREARGGLRLVGGDGRLANRARGLGQPPVAR